ncbi:MAG: fatty acid desaturase [Lentisphaerae bacterium]|nr:fatty acid desaturase [Lentisphaerota bacterium]
MSGERIDWYRTEMDRDTFRELTRRSDARGLVQCLLQLAWVGVTGFAAYYAWHHWHWGAFLLVLFIHGSMMQFLGVTAACHELSHGTPFRSRALGLFFYNLFSFISWNNPTWFRISHFEHHKYTTYALLDQEVELPASFRARDFLKSFLMAPAFWWQPPMRQITYSLGRLASAWDEQIFPSSDPALRSSLFRWGRILLIGHVALAAMFLYIGEWVLIPIVLFPSYGGWFSNLYGGAQHMGLQSNVPDFRRCCRTMLLSRFEAFLYWQMNYHTEHHMYPGVPFFNGHKLHQLLQADGAPEPNHGVLDAWREMRMIQRQQRETPGVAFDAFSRGRQPVYVSQRAETDV